MGNHVFALSTKLERIAKVLAAALMFWAFLLPARADDGDSVGTTPPSFQVRDWLALNLRTRIQVDASGFDPEFDDKQKVFLRRRLRFGADGMLFREVAYSVSVETGTAEPEIRDLFLKFSPHPSFQVQAGRFKIPFGLDQLTDSSDLDFVKRSRSGSLLAPGRDNGAMILGDVLGQRIHYSAAVFHHDGKNSEIQELAAINEYRPGGDRTIAARVTVSPTSFLSAPPAIRNLTFGVAFTRSDLVPGLNSLSGVMASGETFFSRMYVSGARSRRGAELSWQWKSLAIQGEFTDVREQRLGQGIRGEDLPPLRIQAWYVSVVQPFLGRLNNGSQGSFLGSLLPGRSLGLFEATARYEAIRFGGVTDGNALPSRNPRASNVISNEDRAWTLGINWHANRYVKFQVNGVRETLSDPVRTPIDGESKYWTLLGRFQLSF